MKVHYLFNLLIVCCFGLLSTNGMSQAPKLDWLVTQQIIPRSSTWDIAQQRNNVYKVGIYSGNLLLNPARTDTATSSNNGSNASGFIVKYDTNGTYIKGISINAQGNSLVTASNAFTTILHISILNNGNTVVTGRFSGNILVDDTARSIGTSSERPASFVICLDSNLEYVWGNSLSNSVTHTLGSVTPSDLSVGSNQLIFVSFNVVYPANDSGLNYGFSAIPVANNGHRVILNIDGNTGQLTTHYTEFFTEALRDHCNDENNNIYYVMGKVVYKRNDTFQLGWNKLLTNDRLNTDEGSIIYHQGALYLTCFTYVDFDGSPLAGKTHVFAKLDTANGNVLWKKFFTEPSSNSHSIGRVFAKDGELTLVGTSRKALYFDSDSLVATGFSSSDAFIIKYDTAGNLLFKSTLSGPNSESTYMSNEQGDHLYLALQATTTANFVVDGSTPQYLSRNFSVGFAQYTISPSAATLPPIVNLGADTVLCPGTSYLLLSGVDSSFRHLWSNGDTTTSTLITNSGQYWVNILDAAGSVIATDTIVISVESISIFLGNDTNFADSIVLNTGLITGNFLWNTGSTSSDLTVKTSGTYWISYTSTNGCVYTDTIIVQKNATQLIENSKHNISVFPNPAYNYLAVKVDIDMNNMSFRIYTSSGILVSDGNLKNKTLDISGLKTGSYFVIFINDENSSTHYFTKI